VTTRVSPLRVSGSCRAWEGSRAAISDGSEGRDGGGGATVVPHTIVGSSSRVDSTYFWTDDFSAWSASRAAVFSAKISDWRALVESVRMLVGLRRVRVVIIFMVVVMVAMVIGLV